MSRTSVRRRVVAVLSALVATVSLVGATTVTSTSPASAYCCTG